MEVVYNGVKITSQNPPYQELLLSETINQPIVTITPNTSRYSSLIMYDPDSVKGIFIHWLVINIPRSILTCFTLSNYCFKFCIEKVIEVIFTVIAIGVLVVKNVMITYHQTNTLRVVMTKKSSKSN